MNQNVVFSTVLSHDHPFKFRKSASNIIIYKMRRLSNPQTAITQRPNICIVFDSTKGWNKAYLVLWVEVRISS